MDRKSYTEEPEIEVQIAPELAEPASAGGLSIDHLQAVVGAVLSHEGRSGQITLVITDDEGIRQLNRDFLGQDHPTDVLAFGFQEEVGPFVAPLEAGTYLGDVIVSYPRAVTQAGELGHSVREEVNLLVVHGVLHLLGYDHASEEGKKAMWSRQEAILRSLYLQT